MRIMTAKIQNFGSYKELEFDFTYQGLALIQGATGSGKSTLCDIIPWGLFGRTAKGGSVDEVVSWPGDEVTKVTLYLENVTISRSRGLKAKDNDLFFWLVDGTVTRGKDLQDTQKLINNLLQIDIDLYLAGAYFHEFSQTAQFFTATAKNRRLICEQIVDLTVANIVANAAKLKHKEVSTYIDKLHSDINILEAKLSTLERIEKTEETKAFEWDKTHLSNKASASTNYDRFEKNRTRTIHNKCITCGTLLSQPREVTDKSINPYLMRLAELETAVNPHTGSVKDYSKEIFDIQNKLALGQDSLGQYIQDTEDLELLQDVVSEYRSVSIINAINQIETKTNQLLTDHFDAEIKVILEVEGADKLEVRLLKDGNNCSFTQLSKGQRQLLKLCFATALMQGVSNQSGVNFNQVFFDEATDGLDTEMKLKAYGMLETLSQQYESVFLVEHSEDLKAMANNSYRVELINGESRVEKV